MSLAIHPIDLAIVLVILTGMVAFGLWIGREQKDVSDYLLGDRSLPWWLVLLSIVSTETSAATFLSVPGLAYGGDMTFLQLAMGYVIGRYVVGAILLPLYFRGQLFTAYEVLSNRFGGATKQAASMLFLITRSLADGLRLFLAAIVLKVILFPAVTESASQTPVFDTNLSLAVVVMGVTTILYTFFGGMKAVVWTDAIQFFVYVFGAAVAGAVVLTRLPEGWTSLVEYGQSHAKFTVFDIDWNPDGVASLGGLTFPFPLDLSKRYTLWSGIIGGAFLSVGTHGADQLMVQRYLSARSEKDARRALSLSGWIVLAQFALFLLLGVGLAAFYDGRQFARSDEALATFIVNELPVGLVGVTLAAVFAAAFTGSLNSSAAVAVNDLYVPLVKPDASPHQVLSLTRRFTILFGVVQICVGIAGQYLKDAVVNNVLSIAGFTTGVVLGIFFLGVFTRHVGQRAALMAFAGGLTCMTAINFLTTLAWPWFVLVGSLGTLLLGLAGQAILSLFISAEPDRRP